MNDSFDAAIDPKNKSRNRYKNIYPCMYQTSKFKTV